MSYIQQLSGESGFEITREEGFIPNDDGTLSVDINSPDLATATCFIISRTGTDMDNYQNSFMVLKGTNQVFYSDILNSGFLLPLTDVAQFALIDNSGAVCDTAEQAILIVQQFTVDTSWELLYEENFIDTGDGTLAIEVNNPDNATVPCFVIQPVGGSDAGGYSGYYIVRKGTNEIYQHQDMNSSDLVKVSG